MEKKKYFVNNVMFIFGLSYFVVLVAVAIALFTISRPGSAAIFLALALSFGFIGFRYGSNNRRMPQRTRELLLPGIQVLLRIRLGAPDGGGT